MCQARPDIRIGIRQTIIRIQIRRSSITITDIVGATSDVAYLGRRIQCDHKREKGLKDLKLTARGRAVKS